MIVELKQIGNVVYEQVTSEDITEAYYDTKIRLENAEKFQKRYLDLLSKAKTVEESVKVEQELHRITNEIDTLKGKMNLYQNMVQYSKINVYLVERERKGPTYWCSMRHTLVSAGYLSGIDRETRFHNNLISHLSQN